MLLYHGSNVEVHEPNLIKQTRGLDFGPGFYLTSNKNQALDFSETVVNRRRTGTPIVSIYDFDDDIAEIGLNVLHFVSADGLWLEFIRDNRMKTYRGKEYDVIIGPVADDRIFPTIQALMLGQFSIEATLVALKPYKLFDQYCFASKKALSNLKFAKSIFTREERRDGESGKS